MQLKLRRFVDQRVLEFENGIFVKERCFYHKTILFCSNTSKRKLRDKLAENLAQKLYSVENKTEQ